MPLNAQIIEQLNQQLLLTKQTLNTRVDLIHDHAKKPLDANSTEQAAELGNVEVVSALESEAVVELAEINAALQRIEADTYGICISCGEDIGEARLLARPASAECVDCAEESQRLGIGD